MDVYKRKPDLKVEIIRPDYNSSVYSETRIATFGTGLQAESLTNLLSYEFSENIKDPMGNFNLSLTPEYDKNGKSWLTKIKKRDIVLIYEFGKKRFCGLVGNVRYTARMSDEGNPSRAISVSGMSMSGLLATFNVVLDLRILKGIGTTSEAESRTLMARIAQSFSKGAPIKNALTSIGDSFFSLVSKIGIELNIPIGISSVMSQFIDYKNYIDGDMVFNYPVAYSLYEMGENNLWSIWNNMINPPINEIFGRWENDKLGVNIRETPFDPEKWSSLEYHSIDPVTLEECDIGTSDNDVKTFFLGTLPGSGISRDLALVLAEYNRVPTISKELFSKYGLIPLYTEYRYFDKNETDSFNDSETLMRQLSEKLKSWYEPNPDLYNGTIKKHTTKENYARIGEKLRFLGGEFYIEGTTRTWEYGGHMYTNIQVTRGGRYSETGEYLGPLENVDQRVRIFE